jgi:hypothetical protein
MILLAITALTTPACLFSSAPGEQDSDAGQQTDDAGPGQSDANDGADADGEIEDDGLYVFLSFQEFEVGGGLAAADDLCNTDRNRPNVGRYKALLGAPGRHAGVLDCLQGPPQDWVLNKNQLYINADDEPVFETNTFAVFFDWPMTNPVSEAGINFGSGTERDWCFAEDLHCEGWTNADEGEMRVGWAKDVTNGFMSGGKVSCGRSLQLMCVEQPRRQGF